MGDLSFGWSELGSLAAELRRPLRQISVESEISRPSFVTFWQIDGTGLRVHSEMHDVAERREVGVLNFERVSAPKSEEMMTNMSPLFDDEIVVSKLLIRESGAVAESGVVLETKTGDEIVVVAGVYPYSLAIQGVSSLPYAFAPEYPLDQYLRVPFA